MIFFTINIKSTFCTFIVLNLFYFLFIYNKYIYIKNILSGKNWCHVYTILIKACNQNNITIAPRLKFTIGAIVITRKHKYDFIVIKE